MLLDGNYFLHCNYVIIGRVSRSLLAEYQALIQASRFTSTFINRTAATQYNSHAEEQLTYFKVY